MSKYKNIIYLVVFASLIYSFVGFNFGFHKFDEGIIVYGAQRVLSGDIPYRDFWGYYPPGQFWLIAGLFKLFGSELIVEHTFSVIMHCAVSIVIYLIARKLVSLKAALLAWFLALLWINTYNFANPMPVALWLSLTSSLFLLKFLFEKGKYLLLIAGLLSGFSLLFRDDIGFFTAIGASLWLSMFSFFSSLSTGKSASDRIKITIKYLSLYTFGWLLILVPISFYLMSSGAMKYMLNDLLTYRRSIYLQDFFLRLPAILPNPLYIFSGVLSLTDFLWQAAIRITFYFPSVMFIIVIAIFAREFLKGAYLISLKAWCLLLFLFLGIMFHIQGYICADIWHLRPAIIVSTILLIYLMDNLKVFSKRNLVRAISAVFIPALTLFPVSVKLDTIKHIGNYSGVFAFKIERARGIIFDKHWAFYEDLVKFIQKNVPENERIFIANSRHERFYHVHDIMLYFLANRTCATRYYILFPYLVNTSSFQEKIVSDIERHKTRYIITYEDFLLGLKQNKLITRIPPLDNLIQQKFISVKQFGAYTVWKRAE